MAEINYNYKDELHTIGTYDEVLKTCHWIGNAMRAIFEDREELYIRCTIAFSSDEMSYECNSIEEFKKYAFGKRIEVKRLLIYATENWASSLVEVFATYHKDAEKQEFNISSKDEMLIINLKEALLTNKEAKPKQKETIIMKYEDNSVHIGDNNQISDSVVGSNNAADVEQKTEVSENKKESSLSKAFWQIVIPIAVGVIVIVIATWLNLQ